MALDNETNQTNDDLDALQRELKRLNDRGFLRMYDSMPRMLGFHLLKGLAFGLGTVLGATILVSFIAFSLAKIDFIPIIGDWAGQIAQQMQTGQ